MLTAIGGSEAEDAVYRELIAAASVTAAELTRTLGLPGDAVEAALAALERRGLASRTLTSPVRFVAAPPDAAVDALLLRRQAEISAARAELDQLVRIYRAGRRARSVDELVEIVAGPQALAERVTHLRQAAVKTFDGFIKPPFVAIEIEDAPPQTRPGLCSRALYDQAIMAYPAFLDQLREQRPPDTQFRIHASLPMKLLIADGETAVLPLEHAITDAAPAAIIVHSCGLLDALIALFEQYWETSLPLEPDSGPPDAADGTPDPRILSLLVAGVTDEAIARQVGISPRTVRRRIQDIMLAAGARNRAHLAWLAARNNWLS